VTALAAAPIEAVIEHWAGLGYYARARNLHKCAQQIAAHHGGQFPANAEQLAELPGIGRSTAAAVAAFAFGQRAAILDGNVKRVLCRQFGIEGFPGRRRSIANCGTWPKACCRGDIEPYTQGLMDLGATVHAQPAALRGMPGGGGLHCPP
jgi:A/G-specific adenine glycosylase